MFRTFTVGLTAAIVAAIPGLAIASPVTHSVVPQHLLAEIGDRPSIWNDAGRTDLTVASTAGVAATGGMVLAVFAPGTTPADHDLGADSFLAPIVAAGAALPASMPPGLADALRRIPAGAKITLVGAAASTPGQVGLPGGELGSVGAPGGADGEGCDDPNLCEYVWLSISLIGMGFKCASPTIFGFCPPPGPVLPKFQYAATQDETIIRNDGGIDTLTVSTIHFKDNRGDDWSRNFIVDVRNFNQPNAGASYTGSATGWWSPVSESFGIPPSATVNPTARLTNDFCSTDSVQYSFGSSSRLDGFQLDWDVLMGVGTGGAFTVGIGYCSVA
jgi:hypothetical protein